MQPVKSETQLHVSKKMQVQDGATLISPSGSLRDKVSFKPTDLQRSSDK